MLQHPRRRMSDRFPMKDCPEEIRQLHGSMSAALQDVKPPEQVIDLLMKTACDFFEAEWACALDVDLELGIWTPARWYNAFTGGMTETKMGEFQYSSDFIRWVRALEEKRMFFVMDVEEIRDEFPKEYAYYKKMELQSLIAVPYYRGATGFFLVKNPHRNVDCASILSLISYTIAHEMQEIRLRQRMQYQIRPMDVNDEKDVVIRLFGGLEIATASGIIPASKIRANVYARIITVLVVMRNHAATAKELAQHIYPEKDPTEGYENIRKVIYRFRRDFGSIFGDNQLIVSSRTQYQLNPYYNIHTDLDQFQKLRDSLNHCAGDDQKIEILKSIIKLYRGHIFSNSEDDHWIISLIQEYKHRYLRSVNELCELLFDRKEYDSVHHYAAIALALSPDSEMIYYWMCRALRSKNWRSQEMEVLTSAEVHLSPDSYHELRKLLREEA